MTVESLKTRTSEQSSLAFDLLPPCWNQKEVSLSDKFGNIINTSKPNRDVLKSKRNKSVSENCKTSPANQFRILDARENLSFAMLKSSFHYEGYFLLLASESKQEEVWRYWSRCDVKGRKLSI